MLKRWLLRIGGALLVTAAALVTILVWRLASAPIALPYLVPHIEAALAELTPGAVAHVGRVELAWVKNRPVIAVSDLGIVDRDGSTLASLPRLALRPSLRAALSGKLALAWIGLSGAQINLARTAEGRFSVDTTDESSASGNDSTSKLIASLIANRTRGGAAAYLSGIAIDDANVQLVDRGADVNWKAGHAAIALRFSSRGISARVEGAIDAHSDVNSFIHDAALSVTMMTDASFAADASVSALHFEVNAREGRFSSYTDARVAIVVDTLDIDANYSADTRAVTIERVSAAVGATRLEASGRIPLGAAEPIQADGTLRSLPADDLVGYWPPTMQPTTRSWIADNIHGGTVSSCRFHFRIPQQPSGALPAEAVDVAFDFENLTVAFLRHFAPLRAARGSATLTATNFIGRVSSAASAGLDLRNGRIDIDLRADPTKAAITAEVEGTIPAILAVIDQKPLEIPKKLGIAPSPASGRGTVRIRLNLPLTSATTSDDVRVEAAADFHGAAHPDLLYGIGLRNGELHIDVADGRVAVRGDVDLTNAPVVDEPLHADFVVERPSGKSTVKGRLVSDGFVADGSLTLGNAGLQSVALSDLRIGRTQVRADLERDASGRCLVSLNGDVLDLEPLSATSEGNGDHPSRIPWPGWEMDFAVKRVLTGRALEIVEAQGRALGEAKTITKLQASGSLAGGGTLQGEFESTGGQSSFEVRTDDAGRAFKDFGIDLNLVGGTSSVAGTTDERTSPRVVRGEILVSDFRVVKAPLLAKALSLGSLEGIADVLSREGIGFTRARVPFSWSNRDFEFRDASAVGAIGITGEGIVHGDTDEIHVGGQVIPSYTLNSALGKIPLVGSLLVGGKGRGVFGLNYRIDGTQKKPEVKVNPLSAITPGILRRMFIDPFTRKPLTTKRAPATPPEK